MVDNHYEQTTNEEEYRLLYQTRSESLSARSLSFINESRKWLDNSGIDQHYNTLKKSSSSKASQAAIDQFRQALRGSTTKEECQAAIDQFHLTLRGSTTKEERQATERIRDIWMEFGVWEESALKEHYKRFALPPIPWLTQNDASSRSYGYGE